MSTNKPWTRQKLTQILLLLWLFLYHLQLSFESIFSVGAIVGTVQWLGN